jgi:hypothetical protein
LQTILSIYPDNTYWLTTHCWQGENRCIEILTPVLHPDTVALLQKIKPTEWNELKTDAIDFKQPFLWFDDDLLPEEAEVLREHDAMSGHVLVDIYHSPEQLRRLKMQYFPAMV